MISSTKPSKSRLRVEKVKVFERGATTLPFMINVMKRPVWVRACHMQEKFAVITKEGTMYGKKGDWLVEGVEGELYPVDNEIFRRTYDVGFAQ